MADKKLTLVRPLRKMEAAYAKDIRTTILNPLFDNTVERLAHVRQIRAAWLDSMDASFEELRGYVGVESEAIALARMNELRRYHSESMRKKLTRAFGIDIRPFSELAIRGPMQLRIDTNAQLISGMVDQTQDRLRDSIAEIFDKKGFDQEALNDTLIEKFGMSDRRAKFIARDQTSKAIGELNQLRQEEIGVTEYEWDDSGDSVVRDTHSIMHGRTCRWDDPTVYKINGNWMPRSAINGVELHPGEDYNCRCIAIAIIKQGVFDAYLLNAA